MRISLVRHLPTLLAALFFAAMWLSNASCKKEKLLESGGELRFSTDTVMFDTVFTALGSATVSVKIFNPQNQRVNLSSVRVEGGAASFFRINADGRPGNEVKDVEIAANDSIYVFATVKVDPTNANTPFIIEDKLVATLNGKEYSLPMVAYGQNAHFITDSVLAGTTTWLTDKPYVVFGYCVVDEGQTLTIPAGCRIYMHANARMFVDGTLKAIGTKQDSIIFQGDRLDRSYFGYEGYPGEWGGIYFTNRSRASEMEHVVLKNGGNSAFGALPALIQVDTDSVGSPVLPQLSLRKVIIENSIGYGLLSFGGTIVASNCLIHSCGASALALIQGGNYRLDHCTIATYGSTKISHNDNPAAVVLNYFIPKPGVLLPGTLNAVLRNCVIAGSLENEFVADSQTVSAPLQQAYLRLESCVIKGDQSKVRNWVTQNARNVRYITYGQQNDSLFRNYAKYDFHPSGISVLVDYADTLISNTDLEDNTRSGKPDAGCYELR